MHVPKTGTWIKTEGSRLTSKSDNCFTFSFLQTTITKVRTCNKPQDIKNSTLLFSNAGWGKDKMRNAENLQRLKCGTFSVENKCGMKGKRRKIYAEKLM